MITGPMPLRHHEDVVNCEHSVEFFVYGSGVIAYREDRFCNSLYWTFCPKGMA